MKINLNKPLLLLLLLCSYGLMQADSTISVRGGAFVPTAKRFSNIYGASGNLQLEVATQINENIEVWANVDWFSKCGRSIGLRNPTKIRAVTLSTGLKFPYELYEDVLPYLGVGACFSGITINNKTVFGRKCTSKTAIGIALKSGTYVYINDDFFLDLFVDYFYQPVRFQSQVNVGGLRAGLGLGYSFCS